MVTRKRLRTVLNALALYTIAGLVIGYFAVNAYTGDHGLKAKQDLDQQIAQLTGEVAALKAERRAGSAGSRCSSPTVSIPICWTSARGRCSTTSTPASSPCGSSSPDRKVGQRRPLPHQSRTAHFPVIYRNQTAPRALPPCGNFGYWGSFRRIPAQAPHPRRQMAVASNKQAAQPARRPPVDQAPEAVAAVPNSTRSRSFPPTATCC